MKKGLILAVALVLVFSSIALAKSGLDEDKIDVKVSVSHYAKIDVDGEIIFNITNLGKTASGDDGYNQSSKNATVYIETNAPVNVKFEENISRELGRLIGASYRVWRFDIHTWDEQGAHDYDRWIVSPNIIVSPWTWRPGHQYGAKDGMGRLAPITERGRHKFTVGMAGYWRTHDRNGNPLPWYLLPAGDDIEGTMTVLVEASPSS